MFYVSCTYPLSPPLLSPSVSLLSHKSDKHSHDRPPPFKHQPSVLKVSSVAPVGRYIPAHRDSDTVGLGKRSDSQLSESTRNFTIGIGGGRASGAKIEMKGGVKVKQPTLPISLTHTNHL